MAAFICFITGLLTILLSKYLFGKWLNHLFIYAFSWMVFTTLYELKLIKFITISTETWVIIISTFIFFILGVLTVVSVRGKKEDQKEGDLLELLIIHREKIEYKVIILLWIFTAIGFLSAVLHWYILINKFGSVTAVLVQSQLIYRMRIEGNLDGGIPYIKSFSYAAVFLGAVLTSMRGKLTIKAILPLIAIIFEGMASAGRAGIFLAFVEFAITFIYFRHLLSKKPESFKLNKINIAGSVIIVLVLFLGSTTLIRTARKTFEDYKASTQTLRDLEGTYLITPSIYFYFSSNIGVLSKYFEHGGEQKYIGENTFLPVYNILSKFNIITHPKIYPKGYFIPLWSNSATYLRDLHEDYGFPGVLLAPFLLGFFCTFSWYRFYNKGTLINFTILIYLNLIVAFSTFYIITRAADWYLSLLILILSFYFITKKTFDFSALRTTSS